MKKDGNQVMKILKNKIYSVNFMERNRNSEKDFTRKRKLPFTSLVLFMVNIVKQTLQKELTNFMSIISSAKKNITKSAFCQSRMKLKPEAFIELNDLLNHEFYTDNDFKIWKGFRLFAIDGSTIQLPNSQEIIEEFGCAANQYGGECRWREHRLATMFSTKVFLTVKLQDAKPLKNL